MQEFERIGMRITEPGDKLHIVRYYIEIVSATDSNHTIGSYRKFPGATHPMCYTTKSWCPRQLHR